MVCLPWSVLTCISVSDANLNTHAPLSSRRTRQNTRMFPRSSCTLLYSSLRCICSFRYLAVTSSSWAPTLAAMLRACDTACANSGVSSPMLACASLWASRCSRLRLATCRCKSCSTCACDAAPLAFSLYSCTLSFRATFSMRICSSDCDSSLTLLLPCGAVRVDESGGRREASE